MKGKQNVMNNRINQELKTGLPWIAVLAIFVLVAIIPSPLAAQSQSGSGKGADEWQYTITPYLMIPWMNGDAAVKGQDVKVSVGAGDIFDALDFGAMGYFEARKSKWGVGVDAVYMNLNATAPILNGKASADLSFNQGAYSFIGLRQLSSKVDFLAGIRYNVLQGALNTSGPLQLKVDQTKQWVDPIVGLKVHQRLGGPVSFSMEGDIGGFGAGSSFAWNLFPNVGIDVGKRATLKVGYRVLSMDYETGSGLSRFKYDITTQALVFGAAFHF